MDQHFTGRNLARLHARQSRAFLGAVLLTLMMGLFLSLGLLHGQLQRQAAFAQAEARV